MKIRELGQYGLERVRDREMLGSIWDWDRSNGLVNSSESHQSINPVIPTNSSLISLLVTGALLQNDQYFKNLLGVTVV